MFQYFKTHGLPVFSILPDVKRMGTKSPWIYATSVILGCGIVYGRSYWNKIK